ncbi:hypothetical protein JKP88DRAFT_349443 [Tribonema minus]|uniref:Uncharacterized protein n=1 Tax=Tribonema minus TaxID=303371 RepID=A0A835YTA8_9STRA|nr:hypothetical protein JKP88DRAFT_349443 [Tribonema minus]
MMLNSAGDASQVCEALEKDLRSVGKGGLSSRTEDRLWGLFTCFREDLDVSTEVIRRMVLEYPPLLMLSESAPADTVHMLASDSPRRKVAYLAAEVGLSPLSIAAMTAAQPAIFGQSLDGHLRPAISFFTTHLGLELSAVRAMVVRQPRLLSMSIDSNLQPKVEYLMNEVGMTLPQVAKALASHPSVLCLSLDDNIAPTVGWLRAPTQHEVEDGASPPDEGYVRMYPEGGLGLSREDTALLLSRQADVLCKSVTLNLKLKAQYFRQLADVLCKSVTLNLKLKAEYFRQLGLTDEQLRQAVTRHPALLCLSVEHNIAPKIAFLQSKMALSSSGIAQLIAFLQSEMALSSSGIAQLVAMHGNILTLSLTTNLRPKLGLFHDELGAQPDELAKFPHIRPIAVYTDIMFERRQWAGTPKAARDTARDLARNLRQVFRKCLDLYSGTGGFALNCALGGASEVVAVEKAAWPAAAALSNARMNKLTPRVKVVRADVEVWVREAYSRGSRFGMVILDPPSFSKVPRSRRRAVRRLDDAQLAAVAAAALAPTVPGGLIVAVGCAHAFAHATDLLAALDSAAATIIDPCLQLSIRYMAVAAAAMALVVPGGLVVVVGCTHAFAYTAVAAAALALTVPGGLIVAVGCAHAYTAVAAAALALTVPGGLIVAVGCAHAFAHATDMLAALDSAAATIVDPCLQLSIPAHCRRYTAVAAAALALTVPGGLIVAVGCTHAFAHVTDLLAALDSAAASQRKSVTVLQTSASCTISTPPEPSHAASNRLSCGGGGGDGGGGGSSGGAAGSGAMASAATAGGGSGVEGGAGDGVFDHGVDGVREVPREPHWVLLLCSDLPKVRRKGRQKAS